MSGAISGATIAMLAIAGSTAAASIGLGIYEDVSKPSAPVAPTQAQTNEQTAQAAQASALAQAQALTQTPVCVGFGVSTPEQAHALSRVADGIIVGSAIVKEIERHAAKADLAERVSAFIRPLVKAVK